MTGLAASEWRSSFRPVNSTLVCRTLSLSFLVSVAVSADFFGLARKTAERPRQSVPHTGMREADDGLDLLRIQRGRSPVDQLLVNAVHRASAQEQEVATELHLPSKGAVRLLLIGERKAKAGK